MAKQIINNKVSASLSWALMLIWGKYLQNSSAAVLTRWLNVNLLLDLMLCQSHKTGQLWPSLRSRYGGGVTRSNTMIDAHFYWWDLLPEPCVELTLPAFP